MPRRLLLAGPLIAVLTPAAAQTGANPAPIVQPGPPRQVAPGTPAGTAVVLGGRDNSGPGSGTIVAPTGTGAATVTTDPGAGSNAGTPERGVPQTGGGGGEAGGSGG